MKMKKFIIFALVFVMLSSSLVSADFLDWVTGKVTVEPSTINILNEGETKIYTINGKDYDVTLDYVNPTSAKFSINGEITAQIPVHDSYKLADGAIISVKNITHQDFAGGVKKAEFTLSVGEKNADYFFAVDDYSPAKDILLMQDIISNLQLNLPIGNAKLNSEITRADLANRVTTFIYYQNVLIIVGDTSPAEHVIFAQKISNYLKGRGIISIQKLSSEITSDDLTKEIEICSDSDDGKNYYVKGITRIGDRPEFNEDYCSGNRLSEFYCNEAGGTSEFYYMCPYGCEDGACKNDSNYQKIPCTDSDDGKNYYVRGFIRGHEEPNGIYDACADADEVYENYCENNSVKVYRYKCPSGKCKNGVCIRTDVTTDKPNQPIDLSNYPNMIIKDDKLNAYLVVGDHAPAEDVISVSDIAVSLQYTGKETTTGTTVTRIDVEAAKLVSEIANPLKLNIISVGNPCNNPISAQLMGNPAYCTKGFTKDEGLIKLYNYNGYAQIVVAGYSDQDTRKATKVLANWEDYDLEGDEICVYGPLSNPSIKDCEQILTCTDSDGGENTYTQGEVIDIQNGVKHINKDECILYYDIPKSNGDFAEAVYECSGNNCKLMEQICIREDTAASLKEVSCLQGCKDGACIPDSSKILPPFTAAVYDKAPASDVIIISDAIVALKGKGYGKVPIGTSKLFSEVNAFNLDNKVTLAVYLGEAVIIVGEHSPASHVIFAVDIKEILSKKYITPKTILSSEVPSADLLDLFEEEDEDIEIPEEEETQEPTITPPTQIKVQPDKCKTNADCSDNNACTSDLCSGTPKKCSYIEVSLGCNYNGNCIPMGVRAENNYCDIDRTIKSQLGAGEECNNNYECSTNICVNNECISPSFIQKIIDWFKKLFGG